MTKSPADPTGGPAKPPLQNTSFLDAALGRAQARPPVWIMRQAGRYLPEYRRVRAKFPSFLDFCRSPEHVAEVTVQPVDIVGVDAAILFSDILVLLPPMGLQVEFLESKGPVIANPLRDAARIAALPSGNLNADLDYVFQGIRLCKQALGGRVPLIGFAGGPFTVASYMVEGGSSKELARLKALMFGNPAAFAALLEKLASVTAAYLVEQVDQGADAVTLMDSWAGYLGPQEYRSYVMPHTRSVVQAVKRAHPRVPVIHYANGAPTLAGDFVSLGADVVGLDWRLPLEAAFAAHPAQVFQGNLDPCFLYSPPEAIAAKVKAMKAVVGKRAHVYNLGHGILPDTPVENAKAFVAAVHDR